MREREGGTEGSQGVRGCGECLLRGCVRGLTSSDEVECDDSSTVSSDSVRLARSL